MDLDETIAKYRMKAKDAFEWQAYAFAKEQAQLADWLTELRTIRLSNTRLVVENTGLKGRVTMLEEHIRDVERDLKESKAF